MGHLQEAMADWLRASGYKPDTVDRCVRVTKQYGLFVRAHDLKGLEKRSIERFLSAASKRVRPHTLLNYHRDLKRMMDFAVSEGLLHQNPMSQIPKPRVSINNRERDVEYSAEEVAALMEKCPSWNWLGVRNRAIICLFWCTGIRVSELANLKVADVDWDEDELRIEDGKDGSSYKPVLTPECRKLLRRHLIQRPNDSPFMFTSHGGKPLTRHNIEQMMRRMAERAGWKQACYPHGFRHTFRLRMKDDYGLDDADISALLGHRTVKSTEGYGRKKNAVRARLRLKERMGLA